MFTIAPAKVSEKVDVFLIAISIHLLPSKDFSAHEQSDWGLAFPFIVWNTSAPF
jgi:hypothetical protein